MTQVSQDAWLKQAFDFAIFSDPDGSCRWRSWQAWHDHYFISYHRNNPVANPCFFVAKRQ